MNQQVSFADFLKENHLGKLNTSLFHLCHMNTKPIDHIKVGETYMVYFHLYDNFKTIDGNYVYKWHKVKVTNKIGNKIFAKILDYNINFIVTNVEDWCPCIISKKEFCIKSEVTEDCFDTIDGNIKIID